MGISMSTISLSYNLVKNHRRETKDSVKIFSFRRIVERNPLIVKKDNAKR